MQKTKTLHLIQSSPLSGLLKKGPRQLHKVDLKDGTPATYTTLQRHDWVFAKHTASSYVIVSTGKRLPVHVVERWFELGFLTVCTSPVKRSSQRTRAMAA